VCCFRLSGCPRYEVPFKVEVLWDKETVFDFVVTEFKFYDRRLDDKLFVKP